MLLILLTLLAPALGSYKALTPFRTNNIEVVGPKVITGDPESDAYIDQIMANLRELILSEGLDPEDLPNLDTGFSQDIGFITVHGSAHLYNGRFWGLATIGRSGATSFTVEGNIVRLTAYLSLTKPRAHYDASAEFMGITIHAGVSADIDDVEIYLDAEMDLSKPDGGLQLANFAITHVGHISIDVSGLGPLDWILETIVQFVDAFLKDWIVGMIEGPLRDLLQGILDNFRPDIPSWLL